MRSLQQIQELQSQMIKNDKKYVNLCNKIDKMINLQYDLPPEISKMRWMRKVISTDPMAAIQTAVRTLSQVEPIPSYQPLNPNPETKSIASDIEMNLLWQLRQSNKRSQTSIVADIVESALRYDKIAVQTVPLKWQMEGMKNLSEGNMPTRYKAAKNLGAFITIVHNPKNIHERYTPLGLDAVLSITVMRAQEAIAFYGEDKTKELMRDVEDHEGEAFVTVFDWWDYDRRLVTATAPSSHNKQEEPTQTKYVFEDGEMDLPFLPWTVVSGGTSLEVEDEFARRPMLAPIAHSDMWETQIISRTLAFSEAIAYSASPRLKIQSMKSDEVRVDYGDINKPLRLGPNEDVTPMQPPQIDQNLLHIDDRIRADMDRVTVAKVLQNLDFPSGTAFATVNAVIKSATSALDPYKQLAEEGLSGLFELWLRWTHHTKDPLIGFGYKDGDRGSQYTLKPEHIDPENIYIDVKLSAHVPTDYMQRIEAAIALNQQMEFPKEDAYKYLDVPNPDQLIDKWEQELLNRNELEQRMKMRNAQTDLQLQQQQMGMQMQAQQMQQQQQAQQQQQNLGSELSRIQEGQTRTGAPRREALSQAVTGNPARSGVSPNVSNPKGNTKEDRTGQARGGEGLAT